MCISQKHRILVGLLVLAATVILWTAASAASSGTCGDSLTWELDNSYMLTIRGTGAMTDYEIKAYTISGVVQYYYSTRPYQWNQAQKLVVEEGVTRIGKGAFYGCSNLTSAKLPDSLTSISDSSFAECSGLTGIRLPDSLKTIESGVFKKCSNLADIHLPANLDRIGQFVFCDCNALKKITIPDHCSEIGNGAFLDCRAVRYAAIGSSGAKALGKAKYSFTDAEHDVELKYQYDSDGKFTGELLLVSAPEHAAAVVIPASVTQIDECVFLNHTDLKKITIPDSVKKIGKYAFKGCTSLEEIILPDLLIAIGEYAFSECSGLSGVTVPKGVTDIADYAFSGCSSLASVTLPEGLYRIGNSAFKDCKNLKRITIPDGVTSVESESFSGCPAVLYAAIDSSAAKALGKRYYSFRTSGYDLDLWYYAGRSDLSVLSADNQAEIAIPAGVKSIHQKAFADCDKLKKITLPDGITSIGSEAFSGCTNLKELTIPDSVTTIENDCFKNCPAILYAAVGSSAAKAVCGASYSFRVPGGAADLQYEITDGVAGALTVISGDQTYSEIVIPEGVTIISEDAFREYEKLKKITIPEGVTIIGNYAFSGCTKLTGLQLPESLVDIGHDAFSNCAGLTELVLPPGVTEIQSMTFSGCSGLRTLSLPSGLIAIGDRAFRNCNRLQSLIIPKGVTTVAQKTTSYYSDEESGAFAGCGAVRYAIIGSKGAKALSKACYSFRIQGNECELMYTFDGESTTGLNVVSADRRSTQITIPSAATAIVSGAFDGCTELQHVTMNASIRTYSFSSLFDGCEHLETITIPGKHPTYCSDNGIVLSKNKKELVYCPIGKTGEYTIPKGIRKIPDGIFSGRIHLAGIVIPPNVTEIGKSAFSGCSGLKTVELKAKVSDISFPDVFRGCTGLTKINIPKNHHTYSSIDGVVFSKDQKTIVYYPNGRKGAYTIPDGVTGVGMAFTGCANLTSVTIPGSMPYINDRAFNSCTGLKTVKIMDGVKAIGSYYGYEGTFVGCTALTSVSIPGSVTTIEENAFSGCVKLDHVIVPEGTTVIRTKAFRGCTRLVSLSLPKSLKQIESAAFQQTAVSLVTLYESLTYIGDNAFEKTTFLIVPKNSYAYNWAYSHYYDFKTFDKKSHAVRINTDGNGTASASLKYGAAGKKVTLKAKPNPGYRFSKWEVISGGVTIKKDQFTIGDADIEIKALFEPIITGNVQLALDSKKKTATVIGPKSKNVTSITIPATFKEGSVTYKVTAVAQEAFADCKKLAKATIGPNVKSIGARTFENCVKLKTLTIQTVRLTANTVGDDAFWGISEKAVFRCPAKKLEVYRTLFIDRGAPETSKFK